MCMGVCFLLETMAAFIQDLLRMIIAIIQARLNSSRLPGKVLRPIGGQPMLWRIVQRARRARLLNAVVVATSDAVADDAVAEFCSSRDVPCFRGSEADVLDRFYHAARTFGAETVVRITGDCPLIDPVAIDKVVAAYLQAGCDYAANCLKNTYPDGLDVEVFSFSALHRAWTEASNQIEREHVTPYLRTSGLFHIHSIENELNPEAGALRWTVDEEQDLRFVCAIYDSFPAEAPLLMDDVLALIKSRPELLTINSNTVRNEGYYLSFLRAGASSPVPSRSLAKSREYLERARKVIPSQTQTFSKGPTQFVQGVCPAYLVRGQGSKVWDVDGNQYIDYMSALGPIILGYNDAAVTAAACLQVQDGVTLSLPHPLEVEVAELLVALIPCAEMVRFGKNGSDATGGAVRVARAFTGREHIACCGYHGWQDWFIGTTTRSLGVPQSTRDLTHTFAYNDITSLERLFAEHPDQIAAVVLEPIGVTEPENGFLQQVKDLTHDHGAVLIFDEVVTGFRLALGGAQQHYGVIPDLACFGKAMANGFPLAAVVGRRDIMRVFDDVFFSFTFGGEAVSLAAALVTIRQLQKGKVIPHLWTQGQRLKDGYNVMARAVGLGDATECIGLAPRTVMVFRDTRRADGLVLRSLVQQELARRGVLFLAGNNISYSHSDSDVEHALHAYAAALTYAATALASGCPERFLVAAPVQAVFRRVA